MTEDFSGTGVYHGHRYVTELFAARARACPDALALFFCTDQGEDHYLTYGELERRASRFAAGLVARGVEPEEFVGLSVGRSPELVIGLLAILKAGATYLPLDPGYPSDRLAYMVKDSGTRQILVDGSPAEGLPGSALVDLRSLRSASARRTLPPLTDLGSERLAYMIYTSGSTGRPKGTLVPHRALVSLTASKAAILGLGPGQRELQFSPLNFDASIYEIVFALGSGATLCLTRQEEVLPGPDLIRLLRRARITHLTVPPSVLAALPPAELPDLRVLCCAGEALPPRLVDRWAPGRRLFNLYGPTEATIWTTYAECRSGAGTPHLGKPVPAIRTHLVDPGLRAVEPRASGEIAIGGIGVARGYFDRPGMSAERFVPDPWAERPGARLYRSGDRARERQDENLEFVGRIDFQVKIRGHRIELGEVESALCKHPEIDSAAVLATPDAPPRLVAFVLSRSPPGPSQAELGRFLRGTLPDYMLPGSFRSLSELPRTPNGKVDRDRLGLELLPAAAEVDDPELRSAPVNPPATPTEEALAEIWRELLGLEEIDRDDDFFALGGQSLLVGRLIARAREALGAELPLRVFFEAPTLSELARRIDDGPLGGHPVDPDPARPDARVAPTRPAAVAGPTLPAFDPPPRSGPIPLSFPQERIWFFEQLAPGNLAYNAQATISLDGDLDPERLRRALTEIVRRHEILRTIFVTQRGRPVQVVRDPFSVELPFVDLGEISSERQAVAAEAIIRDTFLRPFDTTRLPLARWRLIRLARREHVLVHMEHHFVHDGWSFGVLLGELEALYEGLADRRDPGGILPPVSAQFADFALWQRDWLQGPALRRYLDHWRRQLEGMPPALDLPTDRSRAEAQTFAGDAHRIELSARFSGALRSLARREGTTLFNVMLGGFAVLVHRYSGATDFGVGSAIANRQLKPLEGMLGMVVNTMVLRCALGGRPSFRQLLGRLREITLEAQAYQDIPFDKLVEELQPERDPSRNPLFQVMFSFHDSPVPDVDFGGLTGKVRERHNGSAKNDLNIIGIPRAEQRVGREKRAGDEAITLIWEFNTDLFDRTTAGRMLRHYQVLLSSAAATAERRIGDLTLLTPGDRHQLLSAWNDTAVPGAADHMTLHDRFEIQARATPGAVAVISGGERWSYLQLNQRANRLAHLLRRQGMTRGDLVGIFLPRSYDMITAVLAALKAGGAYVPLEESWPAERVRGILDRTAISRLLTHRELANRLRAAGLDAVGLDAAGLDAAGLDAAGLDAEGLDAAGLDAEAAGDAERPVCEQVICLDAEDLLGLPTDNPPATSGADDLAYLIFTSGSTGAPKGVVEQHRPAVGLIDWVNQRFGVGPEDRLLFVTALAFDLSVYDIFGILAAGASIRVASAAEGRDPERLVEILCREPITFWDSAPPALQRLVTYLPAPGELSETPALRRVFLSGDWIPLPLPDQMRAIFPRAEVIALGGATEATIWSNFFPVGRVGPDWPSIPYGRPIDNAHYHVLDEHYRPCPIGVRGDLFIGGRCLSLGYALQPRLTAERYLPDPFAGPGGRLYCTGDRARHLGDGNLQFLGRLDNQVKLRGFRIELGEIEAALVAHHGVREGVVLIRGTAERQRLAAFYITSGTVMPEPAELRSYLRRKLPEYMIPATYQSVSSWPLTPTGKLDRGALLKAKTRARATSQAVTGAMGTGGSLHQVVAGIWAEVLGWDTHETIDPDATFFDLGGHSLLMPRIHGRLRDELGVDFGLVELFRNPTLRSLVAFLGGDQQAEAGARVGVETANPRPADTALAIVGFAGRFPAARDTTELWRNLCAGHEAVRTLSDDELLAAGVPAEALADPRYVKRRAPLENPGLFDAAFFGFTPREAEILDPQQRVFLECVWHALEHAGYCPDGLDPRVGIFAGSGENTYGERLKADHRLVEAVGRTQIAVANNPDYLAPRVSYKLDLKGPSLSVQTACSTSLVAVHMARLSLLHGDCEMAVAGGVSVRAQETAGYVYMPGGIGSPDGRVRTFDAQARGTVGGSGAGCVVLKRLADAIADGDTIHAVLRGTAINNDGALKVGFTAPSVAGQATAIRDAHRAAGVAPETIGYVEAHGTGTTLGDPIEVRALSEAFASAKVDGETPCGLGSIKSNLGHLDVAAGAAGLIKTILTLEHGLIPPSLHFEQPNPEIDLEGSGFRVVTEPTPWQHGHGDAPRRAGVSAFGIGGTNAHAVLEEAPACGASDPGRETQLLVLSARSPSALEAVAADLAEHLETTPGLALADAAFTLATGRRGHSHRRVVSCRERGEAAKALRTGDPTGAWTAIRGGAEDPARVAFLLTGQGSQHSDMARALYHPEPVFRASLDRCLEGLARDAGVELGSMLGLAEPAAGEAASRLTQTQFAQPALFAVEYSLARLWIHWGIRPAALLGHSIGELVAACLAGVFSLPDALRLVVERGRLMQGCDTGSMLAVELGEEAAGDLLRGRPLTLAAVNGPRACVVSGEARAIEDLAARLEARSVKSTRLETSHAFHSPAMDEAIEPFVDRVRGISLAAPEIPFLSNVTGTWITAAEATDPAYWGAQLRQTVRFMAGCGELLRSRHLLLEVGPGRSLATLAKQHPEQRQAPAILHSLPSPASAGSRADPRPADSRADPRPAGSRADPRQLIGTLGRLWLHGAEPDWAAFYGSEKRRRVPLPTYPFERQNFWFDGLAERGVPGADERERDTATAAPEGQASETPSPYEAPIAGIWQTLLGGEPPSATDDFFEYGGSSLSAIQLTARLSEALDLQIGPSELLEAPTFGQLVALVTALKGDESGSIRRSCLIRLQQLGRRPPFFLVHPVGGTAFWFRDLAREMAPEHPLFALRSRGLEAGEEPLDTIQDMAAHYLDEIRAIRPRGPYLLGGSSMGGSIAYEMAQQLVDQGEEVQLLTLFDSPCLDQLPPRPDEAEMIAWAFEDQPPVPLDALRQLPANRQLDHALEAARAAGNGASPDAEQFHRRLSVIRSNVQALYAYRPEPLTSPLLFLRAAERRPGGVERPERPWIDLAAAGIEILTVPGGHVSMNYPPHIGAVAERLMQRLRAAQLS